MDVKKRLFSYNMFLRNMISDLFGRSGYNKTPGAFTPYFQYKIGPYKSDYYLYFPKEAYGLQYKNEIFNKLSEFNDADIAEFLEFHYAAYPNKPAFVKFLRYEIYGRLNRKISATRRQKLQVAQEWVSEKQGELQSDEQTTIRKVIDQGVQSIQQASPEEVAEIAQSLKKELTDHFNRMRTGTEELMQSLSESFVTGNIELNNQNHLDGVIKLFKILKDLQAPKVPGKAPEQLFAKFSDTDIAAILRLHFEALKSKQHSSIQRLDFKKADERLPDKNPKVVQLEKALQVFFYS